LEQKDPQNTAARRSQTQRPLAIVRRLRDAC
jgi:hypothetical protein